MPIRLTDKQQQALALSDAGYTHEQIAQLMGIRHRQAAGRLINRAREAANVARMAAANLVGCRP